MASVNTPILETSPAVAPEPAVTTKKKLIRRLVKDRSQQIRLGVQLAFVALNAWLCVHF
jgi:hypothetical protein